jgi:ABC-type transport system involved in Fe-S cluster assembly fused permease/ATPase subunit
MHVKDRLDFESKALMQDASTKFMQDGKVVDEGKHEDLLKRDGLYKSLWSI